jgi:hypothetical protein
MHNQEAPLKTSDSITISITDWNAGTFVFTNTTGPTDITYVNYEYITLTN